MERQLPLTVVHCHSLGKDPGALETTEEGKLKEAVCRLLRNTGTTTEREKPSTSENPNNCDDEVQPKCRLKPELM